MNSALILAVLLVATPHRPTKKECQENVARCNCFSISQVDHKYCKYQARSLPKGERASALARCDSDLTRRESVCRSTPPPSNER